MGEFVLVAEDVGRPNVTPEIMGAKVRERDVKVDERGGRAGAT